MAQATLEKQVTISRNTGHRITLSSYDKIAVDHLYQMYFRSAIRNKRERTSDITAETSRVLKNHILLRE